MQCFATRGIRHRSDTNKQRLRVRRHSQALSQAISVPSCSDSMAFVEAAVDAGEATFAALEQY